jgi:hypothetical protein
MKSNSLTIWINKGDRVIGHVDIWRIGGIVCRQRIYTHKPPHLTIIIPCSTVVIAGLLVALVVGAEVAFFLSIAELPNELAIGIVIGRVGQFCHGASTITHRG